MSQDRCDSVRQQPPPDGCTGVCELVWICRIEGRQVKLCRTCDQAWKNLARKTPALIQRCPNCAPEYYLSRQVSAHGPTTGALTPNATPLTGPLADAIDRAMLAEGILTDVRKRVLSRLAADDDIYISMLLRSSASEAVV